MDIDQTEEFIELMTSFQGRLYAFILSLTGDPNGANDILQETNIILWKKSGEFEMGSNFKAWSFRIANFQIMAHRQRKMRDRLVFDDDMIEEIIAEATEADELYNIKQGKIDSCMSQLPDRQRDLIKMRYTIGKSVNQMAEDLKSTANSIAQALFRARNNLTQCVKTLKGQPYE